MAKSAPKVLLVDALVLTDKPSLRIVDKTIRVGGRLSYAVAESLAIEFGWVGEPTGRRSTKLQQHPWSWRENNGDWILNITFTTEN